MNHNTILTDLDYVVIYEAWFSLELQDTQWE